MRNVSVRRLPARQAVRRAWAADRLGPAARIELVGPARSPELARDRSGRHPPDQPLEAFEGDEWVNELAVGRSRIGSMSSAPLIADAWKRLVGAAGGGG
jgi:hypothetical protein